MARVHAQTHAAAKLTPMLTGLTEEKYAKLPQKYAISTSHLLLITNKAVCFPFL